MTWVMWNVASFVLEIVCVGEVTLVMWKLTSFRSEIVLVSVQDGCIVCASCAIGLQIVLDAPDGTPR